ncbi:MAG: HXXEE domain-containing protein [Propionibacteriaceae bacterium]|nr:HXXEE domain-containing protein [Propionibacteriaceae bacterium]
MNRLDGATAGLFVAWLAHDVEELATMRNTSRDILGSVPKWAPLPDELRRDGLSQAHVNLAIAIMGAGLAAASLDGWRSGGQGRLYQTCLHAFGLHGLSHIAGALVRRRYVTGVATAPVIVLPFWLFARRALKANQVRDTHSRLWPVIFLASGAVAHGLAHWATRRRPERNQ